VQGLSVQGATVAASDRHRLPSAADAFIRLEVLGCFRLVVDNHPPIVAGPSQRLLAYLAVQDHPQRRSHLAGTLWPESSESHAHASLRSALWRLRATASQLIGPSEQFIGLDPAVAVDYRESCELAWRLIADTDIASPGEDDRIDRCSLLNDLLPGWYDEWAISERERFRQLRLHALESLCNRLRRQHRFAEAIHVGYSVLACEPLRENIHKILIRSFLEEGNVSEAYRQYDVLRVTLRHALGVEPSFTFSEIMGPACA
jgi:DNA-binding SARP family transcriptional activator